jgi:secondary thiamine-phosphate synthase enzyme
MLSIATKSLSIRAPRRGLHEITADVARIVEQAGITEGLCTVFIRHTSASLIIQENADPSARRDLETFLDRLVPERASWVTHDAEGDDDMPSHIKAVLTQVSLSIPILGGELALGTWQGVYLWEHRDRPTPRQIVVSVQGA